MEREEPLTDLGGALAQLRSLLGVSLSVCAARIGISAQGLADAEAGRIDDAAFRGIARFHALDEDDLREGVVRPVEGVEGATVFLLHGAYQDFDAEDLGVLDRAMRAARSMSALAASVDGGEALRRRMGFVPARPAGPQPSDAARQGHKLARALRTRLGMGGEPVEDMRSFLEEKLGIAVIVDALVSQDLRAASILDAHRAAAAAVLSADHPDLDKNPALARVYLAHELGHILFDPTAPGSVRVALDDRLQDRTLHSPPDETTLLESRAKGFAAEFLIPQEGVRTLVGAPASPVSLGDAAAMVALVRTHFGTPGEIATFHLHNLGYIQKELKFELRHRGAAAVSEKFPTSLPAAGAPPRRLADLLAMQPEAPVKVEHLSSSAVGVAESPWYVDAARQASAAALDAITMHIVDRALRELDQGREYAACDMLVEHLDDLFLAGEFEVARRMLSRLDPQRLPPKVLSGLLTVSAHAKADLGGARVEFFERVCTALAGTWGLSPERVEAIARRLA